ALESSNQEAGGSSVEIAEAEYMVRASGYLQTIDDFNHIVLKTGENGVPIYLRDVARVQAGPGMRRGIAELEGEGGVGGGGGGRGRGGDTWGGGWGGGGEEGGG
ncbi:efflux RND transporter permease subunit, partial [Enterobacter roggenkampii]|uniref:efflux RND transporter permease subunit n=1 Tax=Enterobacter roggenkampii TaxID=1812935 RepID=UPI002E2B91E3